MSYVIVQKEAACPGVEPLKRAYQAIPRFKETDAIKLARENYGILLRNLPYEEAYQIHKALASEGVPAEVLEPHALPVLPDAKSVKRVEIQDQALMVYDAIGRAVPVEWKHVSLFAAGAVRHFEMGKTTKESTVLSYDPFMRGLHSKTVTETTHKVENGTLLLFEIVLSGGVMRFQIDGNNFLYGYVFKRPELDLGEKFALLLQTLAQRAPHAILNRGALQLRDNGPLVYYSSKNTFAEEIIWMLWKMKTGG